MSPKFPVLFDIKYLHGTGTALGAHVDTGICVSKPFDLRKRCGWRMHLLGSKSITTRINHATIIGIVSS